MLHDNLKNLSKYTYKIIFSLDIFNLLMNIIRPTLILS